MNGSPGNETLEKIKVILLPIDVAHTRHVMEFFDNFWCGFMWYILNSRKPSANIRVSKSSYQQQSIVSDNLICLDGLIVNASNEVLHMRLPLHLAFESSKKEHFQWWRDSLGHSPMWFQTLDPHCQTIWSNILYCNCLLGLSGNRNGQISSNCKLK